MEYLIRNPFHYVKFPANICFNGAHSNYGLEIKTVYLLMITISKQLANTGKQSSISSANQICPQFNKKGSKTTKLNK